MRGSRLGSDPSPHVPLLMAVAWERPFLEALAVTKGNISAACRLLKMSRDTVNGRLRDNQGFRNSVERVRRGETVADESGLGFPSFFEWRERHCAYEDPRTGRYKRAQNFWFQFDAIEKITASNRLIMVLPPGHGKTTLFGVEYLAYRIMRDRNFRGTVIRANETEAGKNLTAVAERLSDHEYYQWRIDRMIEQGEEPIENPILVYGGDYGYITGRGGKISEQWSRQAITVSGKTSGEKEPTLQAKGWGSGLAGNRADLIVMDDAQDPKKYSESGIRHTEKMMELFQSLILGRIYDHQKLVILGNRLGGDDFISALIREYADNPDWQIVNYPAVLNEDRKEVLAPELWTWDGLRKKRLEVGEEVWDFHWMQRETAGRYATFSRDQLDVNKDGDRRMGERPPQAARISMGVDPATAEYTSMVVLGVHPESGTRYVIDVFNERGLRTEDRIVTASVEMARKHNVDIVVFEVRNVQGSMFIKLREELSRYGIRCVDYKTATSTGAQAEETDFDITSIAALADAKKWRMPFGDPEARVKIGAYVEQLCMWRPRPPGKASWHLTRDMVMASLFAESEARKFVKIATRPQTKRVSRAPRWATNGNGGWGWRKPPERVKGTGQTLSDEEVRAMREAAAG